MSSSSPSWNIAWGIVFGVIILIIIFFLITVIWYAIFGPSLKRDTVNAVNKYQWSGPSGLLQSAGVTPRY